MCCVTAYIGTFDSWIKAEIEWQQVLDHFGVSELHFTDFMAREDEFKNDWSDSQRDEFMERLCTIASQRPIMGVGCAIRQHDWVNGLESELRDEWKDPYYFCIYGVLSLIRSYAVQGKIALPLPLFFLFDNKPKFEGAALKLYREYQAAHDPDGKIFGDLAFGSRKKYKPLQIADLLVGVINRRFAEMIHKIQPDSSKMKKPLDLLTKRPIATTFPMAKDLKEFKDFVQRRPLHY